MARVAGIGPDAGPDVAEAARAVAAAEGRIRPHIRETPLEPSARLSREAGCAVHLKLECAQVTGSFKARGAFNRLLSLTPGERARGVVTASTGNHGLAIAHALAALGIAGEIFLPASVAPGKLDALRAGGASLRLADADPGEVERIARRDAEASGRVYVSPYNDAQVIAGQGTVAIELLRQLDGLDAVFIPVGGGGLAAGIAGYLKQESPGTRIVGCQPAACPILAESVRAGRLLELPSAPSLSDATVGLLDAGTVTFPRCRAWVDDWIVVDEPSIRAALRLVLETQSVLIEGAGALGVAALLAAGGRYRGGRVALILSGAHIALPTLAEVLAGGDAAR